MIAYSSTNWRASLFRKWIKRTALQIIDNNLKNITWSFEHFPKYVHQNDKHYFSASFGAHCKIKTQLTSQEHWGHREASPVRQEQKHRLRNSRFHQMPLERNRKGKLRFIFHQNRKWLKIFQRHCYSWLIFFSIVSAFEKGLSTLREIPSSS